jgi:hypothetical protein
MKINPHKTVSAKANGIVISFRESNKNHFMAYQDGHTTDKPVRYQTISRPAFNKVQQKLYAETVYGLTAFTTDELEMMPKTRKKSVLSRFLKAQDILNQWKQHLVYSKIDHILLSLFPRSRVVKQITSISGVDKDLKDRHTFKELGINQVEIAQKLVEEGILPKDFFSLTLKS